MFSTIKMYLFDFVFFVLLFTVRANGQAQNSINTTANVPNKADSIELDRNKIFITRRIENKGFHRFLMSDIRFVTSKSDSYDKECKWLLVESFDTNAYVDSNELKLKTYENMYTFFLSNKVNTETAEYKSKEFKLFIYINNKIINCNTLPPIRNTNSTTNIDLACKLSIKLPIHIRYHAPQSTDTNETSTKNGSTNEYFYFELRRPRLFVYNCTAHSNPRYKDAKFKADDSKENLMDRNFFESNGDEEEINYKYINNTLELPCEKNLTHKNDYLIYISNFYNSSNLDHEALHIPTFSEKLCLWNELKYEQMNQPDALRVLIPIANSDHETIVLIFTLVVVTFLVFSLAKCVRKKIRHVTCHINRNNGEDNDSDNEDNNEQANLNVKNND